MSMRDIASTAALALLVAGSAAADGPGLGKPVTGSDIAAWDIFVFPDGKGLPPGSGTPAEGAPLYAAKCAACHGENGRGGIAGAHVGEAQLTGPGSPKTIKSFWPYSTTLFDYLRRAMPYNAPRSLSDSETYAIVAYILALNKLIGDNDTLNAETLPKIQMPNRKNYRPPPADWKPGMPGPFQGAKIQH